ncbi:MAG: 16S rRNA (adenine(1518)-N(6)/adenine(1519)-N(6))-dimethyltransferase RsmA, partial [bacterium]
MIPAPHELLSRYEHHAKKRFGQHFLSDPSILGRICDVAGIVAGQPVLEIGPGPGGLTSVLMERGAEVTAVELDRDALAFLEQELVPLGLKVVSGDARKLDYAFVDERWRCVANLPYNVANEITFELLEHPFAKLALMYQREVADRICATVGEDGYSALSVAMQLRAKVRRAFVLPPGAFRPPPKVHSAVVVFEPIQGTRIPDVAERKRFERIVRGSFSVRRKMLINGLRTLGLDRDVAVEAVVAA